MQILVVEDEQRMAELLARTLQEEGHHTVVSGHGREGLAIALASRFDVILLDVMLPGMDGFAVVRKLRENRNQTPVLMLTARDASADIVSGLDAGADDYLAKPLVPEELLSRVRVRLDRRRLIRETTERDPLTRCMSRGALLDALASRLSEARRHARTLSVALIDVDRFKRVNDAYGHLVGDHVLMALGRLLTARFRLEDLRGRWGGEEFVIVFPNEPATTAASVLSRVLDEFRRMPFQSDRGEPFFVTFSAGISTFPADGGTVDALIRAADRRLYRAKRGGRAHVVVTDAVAS